MNRRIAWAGLIFALMSIAACVSRREPDVVVAPSFSYLHAPQPTPGAAVAIVDDQP